MTASILPPFGTLPGEAARAAIVLAIAGVLLGLAEVWHRLLHPPAEWTRKFSHFTIGLLALTFPWLIAWPGTLLVAGALAAIPLLWARSRRLLPSLFDVERPSYGEVFFPIAVILLFSLGRTRPVFYFISLLTMVACDALAALLGGAYGRHQYVVVTERRSFEGSAVFLFTSFLAVHLPLLLLTHIDRPTCVLVAVQLALLVTAFEAIGPGGSDNLLVPLATYYLLMDLTGRPLEAVAVGLAVQIGLLAAALALARATRFLTFSGAVGVHLMLYAAFSLGGPTWVVAPTLALAGAILIENAVASAFDIPRGGYHVRVVYYVSIAPLLVLFAGDSFSRSAAALNLPTGIAAFRAAFVGSLAGALGIIAYWGTEALPRVRRRAAALRAAAAAALGFAAVAPLGLWAMSPERIAAGLAWAGLTCLSAVALFLGARRLFPTTPGSIWDLRFLALSVFGATTAVLPLCLVWLASPGPTR